MVEPDRRRHGCAGDNLCSSADRRIIRQEGGFSEKRSAMDRRTAANPSKGRKYKVVLRLLQTADSTHSASLASF